MFFFWNWLASQIELDRIAFVTSCLLYISCEKTVTCLCVHLGLVSGSLHFATSPNAKNPSHNFAFYLSCFGQRYPSYFWWPASWLHAVSNICTPSSIFALCQSGIFVGTQLWLYYYMPYLPLSWCAPWFICPYHKRMNWVVLYPLADLWSQPHTQLLWYPCSVLLTA